MTWRAWSSDADGGVRTSILTAQTTPAPDLTRRVTPQNPRSQHYHHDFAEALPGGPTTHRSEERYRRLTDTSRGVRAVAFGRSTKFGTGTGATMKPRVFFAVVAVVLVGWWAVHTGLQNKADNEGTAALREVISEAQDAIPAAMDRSMYADVDITSETTAGSSTPSRTS